MSGRPNGTGRRARSTQGRRQEILDATLDTLVEVGESKTFIHEVCSRSGVSVGTLYHHFGSKDQLIATLHYYLLNEYQAGAGPILAAGPAAEQGVRETVDYHLRWLVGHPRPAGFLLQQPFAGYRSGRVPAELAEANERFLSVVRAWLDARMDSGELRRLPFDVVVALLIGPVHHWARAALFIGEGWAARRADAASAALGDGAWQALQPPAQPDPGPRP